MSGTDNQSGWYGYFERHPRLVVLVVLFLVAMPWWTVRHFQRRAAEQRWMDSVDREAEARATAKDQAETIKSIRSELSSMESELRILAKQDEVSTERAAIRVRIAELKDQLRDLGENP